MGTARLLLPRFKNASFYTASVFKKLRLFSSSAALIRRPWTHYMDQPEGSDGESTVYERALKLQRPTTIKFQESLLNSVSLIGFIDKPFKNCNTTNGRFGVHTFLYVNSSTNAYRNFRVMLIIWDEMAEMSVQHLKPNDLIYVAGPLVSQTKMNDDGKSTYQYEFHLKITCRSVNLGSTCGKCSSTAQTSGGIIEIVSQTQIVPTLDTRILGRDFGLNTATLLGSKNNSCCMIQVLTNKIRANLRTLGHVYLLWFMMMHKEL